jgi:hypothetical protein
MNSKKIILIYFLSLPLIVHSQFLGGNGNGDANTQIPTSSMMNLWQGTTSNSWSTASNWSMGVVPSAGENLIFSSTASNNLLLDASRTIGNINFNGSVRKIQLGDFNLTLNGTVEGANSSSYVQTTGTGTLIKSITEAGSFEFPVGNSAYNPVSISNNTGSADSFKVRVLDEVYYQGTTGTVASEPRVMRTWVINKNSPSANSGSGVNFVFNWNAGEETAGITTYMLYRHNGTTWDKQTGTTSVTGTALTYTGYTGNISSSFAIGDDIVLLPVSWLDFLCEATQEGPTLLQWRTAAENNTRAFVVERSTEGQSYQSIGEVPAAGYSQTVRSYAFADPQPMASGAYYRVRMEDMNGNSSYSDVCNSKAGTVNNPAPLKVFPNPTDGGLYMIALEPERNFVWEVFSATGKCVAAGNSKDGKANAHLHHLSEGVYQLRVIGSGLSENHRILIQH